MNYLTGKELEELQAESAEIIRHGEEQYALRNIDAETLLGIRMRARLIYETKKEREIASRRAAVVEA